jgi:hypothetical protein
VSEQTTAVVVRGVVEVGDVDGDELLRKGRTASLAHRRLFHVDQILMQPVAEFVRLEKLGVVAAVR